MLQFFSASTSIVNSKRAITECIENALQDEPDLNCDLIIIYTAMGHNFKDLLAEARKLSPNARIAGCTGAGIIGREGPDESMKALAIMAIKGPKNEFAIAGLDSIITLDPYEVGAQLAQDLKGKNPGINMILFHPSGNDIWPAEKSIEGIESIFSPDIPIFGGSSIDNMKGISCFQFMDDQIFERGAMAIGFADPTLKIINQSNHGFGVFEGKSFEVTRVELNCIFELNGQPAWKLITNTLGVPETTSNVEILMLGVFAEELSAELEEEYGSKYILRGIMGNNEDNSIFYPTICKEGTRLLLARRDEKGMFDGVDRMTKKIQELLKGKKPLAVFHADCLLRGRFSFNRILKDEIINRMQYPICSDENTPWLGFYSAGEYSMIGRQNLHHQFTTSLFVIYRPNS